MAKDWENCSNFQALSLRAYVLHGGGVKNTTDFESELQKVKKSIFRGVIASQRKKEQQIFGFFRVPRCEIEHRPWELPSGRRVPSIRIPASMKAIGLLASENEAKDCSSKSGRCTTGPNRNVSQMWKIRTHRDRISSEAVFFSLFVCRSLASFSVLRYLF